MLTLFSPALLSLILFTNVRGWHVINSEMMLPNDTSIGPILAQYPYWDILFHIDNYSELDTYMPFKNLQNPLTIFRYNRIGGDFNRPKATRCVNLVAYENTYFRHFSERFRNINGMDVVIFFTLAINPNENYTLLYGSGVDNANSVYVIDPTRAISISFYSTREYSTYVQEVSRDANGVPELNKYWNTFTDFNGFPLKIGYTECPPFVVKYENDLWGVESEVLKIVAKHLNITPVLDDYSSKYNARNALIIAVNRSNLHVGIGCLGNNIRRNEIVAFSSSLQAEPYITVFAASDERYGPSLVYAVFAPFTFTVWICCAITLFIITLFVKLVLKLYPKKYSDNLVLIPTEVLLEQSTFIAGHSNALRLSFVAWILIGLAISSSYKSKLTAALIMPNRNEPTTLEDLLNQGYQFVSPAMDSTYLIELLQFSTDSTENQIGNIVQDTKDVCEGLLGAVNEWLAVIEERTVIRFSLWNYCYRNMSFHSLNTLRRLKADTSLNGHVWAMPKAAPYKNSVSMTIEWMKSHGLVAWWYNGYNLTRSVATPNQKIKHSADHQTQLIDLSSAWTLIIFGVLVSTFAFLAELFYAKRRETMKPGPMCN